MTNAEFIKDLKNYQVESYKRAGVIPEFAIYRVYNGNTRTWQFSDIISDDIEVVNQKLKDRTNTGMWKYSIIAWLIYNPISLQWEEVKYKGKECIPEIVNKLKEKIEKECNIWLNEVYKEN